MYHERLILVINPGSTSTKIGMFQNNILLFTESITHVAHDISGFQTIVDQFDMRLKAVYRALSFHHFDMENLSAVVGRGGFLKPLVSGTYLINEDMIYDLKAGTYGEHASNLGAIMAYNIASQYNVPAYIVDPIVVDELCDFARVSGHPEIERQSHLHALNVKAVVRKIAQHIGKSYDNTRFIVAHLGSGISIVAHKDGKAIDVNNANNEGPFSPERAGGLPTLQLVKLCYSNNYTEEEMVSKLTKASGLFGYLGTKDASEIEENALKGDRQSIAILDAMIYQIAKEIGAMSTVLEGELDGIILTGGLSYSAYIVERLKKRIQFLADIYVIPGEEELQSLAQGAYRILEGKEEVKEYSATVSMPSSGG